MQPLFNKNFFSNSSANHSFQVSNTSHTEQNSSASERVQERKFLLRNIKEQIALYREKLDQNSLIQNKDFFYSLNLPDVNYLEALISTNLGSYSYGSEMEGWTVESLAKLHLHILTLKHPVFSEQFPPVLLEHLSQIITNVKKSHDENYIEYVTHSIQQLKINESFIMEGGWYAYPESHAMLYRFIRRDVKLYDIFIYNTFEGLGTNGGYIFNERKRVYPYLAFRNVEWEELFFCSIEAPEEGNSALFKRLHQLEKDQEDGIEADLQDVLLCFHHIQHRLELSHKLPKMFISSQRGGNCTVKAFHCLYLHILQECTKNLQEQFAAAKYLILDLRLYTLLFAYKNFKNHPNAHAANVLKLACQNYLQFLDSQFQRPQLNIQEKSYFIASATVQDILNDLDKMGQEEKISFHLEAPVDMTEIIEKTKKTINDFVESSYSTHLPPKNLSVARPETTMEMSWEHFPLLLEQFLGFCKKIEDANFLSIEIEAALRGYLPLLTLPIKQLNESSCLSHLLELQILYRKALFQTNKIASPSIQNTMMIFVALGYLMACRQDESYEVLKDFGIEVSYYYDLGRQDPFFITYNPHLLKDRVIIEKFFNHLSDRRLFDFYTFKNVSYKKFLKSFPEGQLFKAYIKNTHVSEELGQIEVPSSLHRLFKSYTAPRSLKGAFACYANIHLLAKVSSLKHIYQLQMMCVYAYEACNVIREKSFGLRNTIDSAGIRHVSSPEYILNYGTRLPVESRKNKVFLQASLEYLDLNPAYVAKIQRTGRQVKFSENEWIVHQAADENLRFNLALAEPQVQTTGLLKALEYQIERCQEHSFCVLFEQMLFKVIEQDCVLISPVTESLKEPLYIQKFEEVLEKGFLVFVEWATPPKIQEMLFLIKLYAFALQIVQIHKTAELGSNSLQCILRIEAFLDACEVNEILEIKHNAKICRASILLGTPLKQQTLEQKVRFLRALLELPPSTQLFTNYDIQHIQSQYHSLCIHKAWEEVLGSDEEISALGHQLLSELLNTSFKARWFLEFPFLTGVDLEGEIWKVDLLKPELSNSQGVFYKKIESLSLPSFFKSNRHEVHYFGNQAYFYDDVWGELKKIDQHLQKKIEGEWCSLLSDERKSQLYHHHVIYFKNICFLSAQKKVLYIFHPETGDLLYILKEGKLQSADSSCTMHLIQSHPDGILSCLDDQPCVSYWQNHHTLSLEKAKIVYHRFVDERGGSLTLSCRKDTEKWHCLQLPHYILHTGEAWNWDVEINHYLCMVHENDPLARKLLVPIGLIYSKGFAREVSLSFSQDYAKYTYFIYDINASNELQAQTPEAVCYLIHLHLAQKSYQKAFRLIKILPEKNLSSSCIAHIRDILKSSESCADFSPNASAVRLHLLAFAGQSYSMEMNEADVLDKVLALYLIYLRGVNNIDKQFLLDVKNEQRILDFLSSQEKLKSFISSRTFALQKKEYTMIYEVGNAQNAYSLHAPLEVNMDSLNLHKLFFKEKNREARELYDKLKQVHPKDEWKVRGLIYESIHPATKRNILWFWHRLAQAESPLPDLPPLNASQEEIEAFMTNLKKFSSPSGFEDTGLIKFSRQSMMQNLMAYDLRDQKIKTPARLMQWPPASLQITSDADQRFHQLKTQYLIIHASEESNTDLIHTLHNPEETPQDLIHLRENHYQTDCQIATLQSQKVWKFKRNVDAQLLQDLKTEEQESKKRVNDLKKFIFRLIDYAPSEITIARLYNVRSTTQQTISLEQIIRAVFSQTSDKLEKINPYFSSAHLSELRALCIDYMIEATHYLQIQQALDLLKESFKGSQIKQTVLENLVEVLSKEREYDPRDRVFPLIFEYFSELRVNGKQARIINVIFDSVLDKSDNEKRKNKIFQLIMGGGKTTVILSLLLELVAQDGGMLACVLSHHSQMVSLKGFLDSQHRQRFLKKAYVLDYTVSELSDVNVLNTIYKDLKEAYADQRPVLMKTSFPGFISLKLQTAFLSQTEKNGDWIQALQNIDRYLSTHAMSFYDECDLGLQMTSYINMTFGERKNLQPQRAEVVKNIFEVLLRPEIESLISLKNNLQTELSDEDFKQKIAPVVAASIFDNPEFKLKNFPEHRQAFFRYLSNTIPAADEAMALSQSEDLEALPHEQQENVRFLRLLHQYYQSEDNYQKEAAHQIAFAKFILYKVLPRTLSKSFNRSYGRDLEKDNGRVIPYQAVGCPSHTRFGNIYSTLVYHFQSAIQGISLGEIKFLAEKMSEAAEYYSQRSRIPFNQTVEAQQFLSLTGVELDRIFQPGMLEQASRYINDPKDLLRRLNVEAEVAPFHAEYHPKRVKYSAINNVETFNRSVAFSGTPYNHETYHPRFDRPLLDEGSEGSLLNALEKYEKLEELQILEIPGIELTHFLDIVRYHPKKSNLRAFVDSEGLLRNYSNEEIAKSFLYLFEELRHDGGPDIDGLIYVHKFSAEELQHQEGSSESYVLLKPDEPPIRLNNIEKAELNKYRIRSSHVFILMDEPRATGTNIHLDDEALFLVTVDHRTPMRKALQAVFRARKILKSQRVDFIMTSKSRSMLANRGAKLADLKESWIKNEALGMQEDQQLARLEMIKNVIWKAIHHDLHSKDFKVLKFFRTTYEQFLVDTFVDQPFEQYGRIEYQTPAYPVLERFAQQLLQAFIKRAPHHQVQVSMEMNKLLDTFKKQMTPSEMVSQAILHADDLDMTVEVEVEVEAERLEEQLELELDLKQEMEDYNLFTGEAAYREKEWKIYRLENLWENLKPRLLNLQDAFKRTLINDNKNKVSTKLYAQCFPEHFWITDNFYYTYNRELPLLHRYSKLAAFILVLPSDGKDQWVFLSEKDAGFFANLLKIHPNSSIFLLDASGLPEVNSEMHEKPHSWKGEMLKNLWFVNLYNGNLEYVEKYYDRFKHLIEGQEALVARFIQLRIGHNPQHLRKLLASSILDLNKVLVKHSHETILFSSRRREIEKSYHHLRTLSQQEIAVLDPQIVKNIASHQVSWLVTKEQIAQLSQTQLYHLSCEQLSLLPDHRLKELTNPALIQALPPSSLDQLKLSQLNFLSESQAVFVKKDIIKTLTKSHADLICKLSTEQIDCLNDDLLNLLSVSQINLLTEKKLLLLSDLHLLKLSYTKFQNCSDPVKERVISFLNHPEGQPEEWLHLVQEHHVPLLQEKAPLIKFLSAPQQLIGLKPIFFKQLDMKQLRILSEARLALTEDQIRELSAEQIQQLNANHLHLISQLKIQQVVHLNDESLQLIPAQYVKEFEQPEVISRLTHPKLLLSVTQEQFFKLEDSLKKRVLMTVNQSVNPSDLQNFHLPLISPDSTILGFILAKEMLEQLSPSCFAKLQPKQLTNASLGQLSSEQVQQIPAARLQYVCVNRLIGYFSESQIQALKPHQVIVIQKLSLQQLYSLDPEALKKISFSQLKAIEDPILLNRLTSSEHLLKLTPKQFSLLELEAKQRVIFEINRLTETHLLQDYHIQHILPEGVILNRLNTPQHFQQLPAICFRRLAYYQIAVVNQCDLTLEQIQKIPSEFISILNQKFYKDLSADQISKLTVRDNECIQKLSADQLQFLTNEALQCISVSQLLTLSKEDLNRIKAAHLLLSIPFERYKDLDPKTTGDLLVKVIGHPNARSHLKPYHYNLLILSPTEVPKQPIEMLLKVHFSCFAHLTSQQVIALKEKKLNAKQISLLSMENLALLFNPQHIQLISTRQLQNFTLKHAQQIPYLNQQQLAHLPGNLFNHLAENQIPWIPVNSLASLKEPRLMKFLSSTQIQLLTQEHAFIVPHLGLSQLKDLKIEMLEYLSAEQIKDLTEAAQDSSHQEMCETFQKFQQLLQIKKDHSS